MQIKPDEITSILKSRIEGLETDKADLAEVGTVLSVADGIARVHGLENAMSFEMLEFPHDVTGLALNLEADNVGVVMFGNWNKVVEGDTVKRIGDEIQDRTGKRIELTTSVDPDVIGGLAMQVGNVIMDATIRARLERLRKEVAKAA